MKTKSYLPLSKTSDLYSVHHPGAKAFFLEPLLVLGSFLLWLVVLPLAGLLWSGAILWKRPAVPDSMRREFRAHRYPYAVPSNSSRRPLRLDAWILGEPHRNGSQQA